MDMLVKLYALPDLAPAVARQQAAGITIRRAIPPERHLVADWVGQAFSRAWVSETEMAFSHHPVSCFIAVEDEAVIGFGCYNATYKGFFGPTGVAEDKRGHGTGAALLLACLHALYAEGFGYAIIGAAGPQDFYSRTVGAVPIEDSWPGIYRGMLREKK
ncbi:MAG: GNAT family N-acetyltransferase [Anaerolineae bacterium]|nr:GNAT family N-acetyltransferase [Anaerolineae bacterium]